MRQPNRAQWRVIVLVAFVIVLAWPPSDGLSLGAKATRWLADPADRLPQLPPPLPMGLGDDGDAVAQHDQEMAAYFEVRDQSAVTRWRLRLKDAGDPFEPGTQRQLLVGLGVAAALLVWRLGGKTV